MRNRCKTLLRDHLVLEVTLKACPKHAQSQPYLRPSPFKDLKDLPCATVAEQDYHIVHNHHRVNKRRHHKTKQLSLPIFQYSTSDNAITYNDWRSDIDNYIREGHSPKLTRNSVLCTLEGHPCYTTKMVMDDWDGSLHSIMEVLDTVYGGWCHHVQCTDEQAQYHHPRQWRSGQRLLLACSPVEG